MTVKSEPVGRLPPRWFIRTAWIAHRAIDRLTDGRRGLWRPKPGGWGTMRLRTIERRSGRERGAILGRAAEGDERARLWARWAEYDQGLDGFAGRRSRETQVVVLGSRLSAATGAARAGAPQAR